MRERLLLCTDLDRTVLPNGEPSESAGARPRFRRVVEDPRVTLVYVTGRDMARVDAALAVYELPAPAFLIADVGTTIAVREGNGWRRWARWDETIGADWNVGAAGRVRDRMEGVPGLDLQEESRQSRFKVSYTADPSAEPEALLEDVRRKLNDEGLPSRLVWSLDDAEGVGLLDVLPARASKRRAVEFLMAEQGFAREDTVFAGDSGNDLDVLVSPIPAVIVKNATEELKSQALREAAAAGWEAALYVAEGGWGGMNGNYAAGVLEGIAHFHPEFPLPMEDRA